MMKKLLLIVSLIFSVIPFAKAQDPVVQVPVDEDTKLITYKEVVQQQGNKTELYNRALEWINKTYKNPSDVTRVRNPENGVIELIHRIELNYTEKDVTRSAGIVDYFMKIECRDGRYRYTITNFNLRQVSRYPIEKWMDKSDKDYKPVFNQYLGIVDTAVRQIIASLKEGMQPPVEKKPDEW